MKKKIKYLAQWVKINQPTMSHHGKCGVVMDEDYLYNGVICCRVIIGPEVIPVEAEYLKLIQS
jgi:hypothetical protein